MQVHTRHSSECLSKESFQRNTLVGYLRTGSQAWYDVDITPSASRTVTLIFQHKGGGSMSGVV